MIEPSTPDYLLPKATSNAFEATPNALSYGRKVKFLKMVRTRYRGLPNLQLLIREIDDSWEKMSQGKEASLIERGSYEMDKVVRENFKNTPW